MRNSSLAAFILFLALLITGCVAPQQQPVPSSTAPLPTRTPLPPSETPTPAPTPTWTPIPYGTLYACNYYEGEKVDGFIRISDRNGKPLDPFGSEQRNSGCDQRKLSPGIYNVSASWGYEDVHCYSGRQTIEMLPNGRIELDLIIECPE